MAELEDPTMALGDAPQEQGLALQQDESGEDTSDFDQVEEAYEQVAGIERKLENIREKLDELLELGLGVSEGDVIKVAGELVAGGIEPEALASILAEMPTQGGGEAIAGWLASKNEEVSAQEQEAEALMAQMRQTLGALGMAELNSNPAQPAAPASASPMSSVSPLAL